MFAEKSKEVINATSVTGPFARLVLRTIIAECGVCSISNIPSPQRLRQERVALGAICATPGAVATTASAVIGTSAPPALKIIIT